MATETTPDPVIESGITPYKITVRQFERMIDAGVFAPMVRLELLGGILVENADKMTQNQPHVYVVDMLAHLTRGMIGPEWIIREEKPIQLGHTWRPEPDVAVALGPRTRYAKRHPRAGDLAFIVEVSDSTYRTDHLGKRRRYAGAGIPIYWIARFRMKTIEVYSDPTGRGSSAHYRVLAEYARGQDVPVEIDGREIGRIAVNDLYPANVG